MSSGRGAVATGEPLRVCIAGAAGRMGRVASELLRTARGFEVDGEIASGEAWEPALSRTRATVGLDFTVAGQGYSNAQRFLAAGLRPLVGTSGVTPEEATKLDRVARARGLGGLVVPNFSLAMVAFQRAARLLAPAFDALEIVEEHHAEKRDAPSATALETARQVGEALAALGRERPVVPIHSIRLPGLYAHQELRCGRPGETLSLRHDLRSPEAFGPGILLGLRFTARAVGVHWGLERALQEEPTPAPGFLSPGPGGGAL